MSVQFYLFKKNKNHIFHSWSGEDNFHIYNATLPFPVSREKNCLLWRLDLSFRFTALSAHYSAENVEEVGIK